MSYEPDSADPTSIAAEVRSRVGGTYSIDTAIALAIRQNSKLAALTAEARAAAAITVPFGASAQFRGRNETIEAMIDPIALLGLGPRGRALDTASAQSQAAVAQLVVARWRTVVEVTTAFLIDAALGELAVADVQLDTTAFERAGLASDTAAAQLRAAIAHAKSERTALHRARADNLARLRRLLGLPRAAELSLVPIPSSWFQPPSGTADQLLRRPDLRLSAARFTVADAKFKQAVAEQYPSLQIGPNVSLRGDPLRAMGMLVLPIGMRGLAEAARERREAARHELTDAFLGAQEEATLADEELHSTSAQVTATRSALLASSTAWTAARTHIEVDPDAFGPFANAARTVIRDTREHRRAVIAHVRAQVERARAFGWPNTEEEER